MTRLGTVCPGTKFRFEVPGLAAPAGQTVIALGATTVLVTVTFMITPATPELGTFDVPETCTVMVCPAQSCALDAPRPMRVSRIRLGTIASKRPAAGGETVGVAT